MSRTSTLLHAAYAVCRFLIQERDLPSLLQGICDRLVDGQGYRSALLVLIDQEAGGMITAETGLGERIGPVMDDLRQGRLPECGVRVLQGESDEAHVCRDGACSLCATPRPHLPSTAVCAPLRCSSTLSGFMILQLPLALEPDADETSLIAELAESVTQALRQLILFEAFRFREQELQQAEERYELALQASQAGLWDWNIKTGEMYTSPDQWELLDYREGDEASGVTRRFIHPEDRERVLAVLNEHLTGSTDEYRIEYRVCEPDGEWSWFLDRGQVVERDENSMPVRMTGTHQNITLQKRQEQALAAVQQQLHDAVDVERTFLQTVIDSAGDPVMVIDLDFNLLLINQAAARLVHGNGEIDTLQGQKCYHLFCAADLPCRDARFPCPVAAVKERPRPAKLLHNPYHGNRVNNTFELEVSPLRNSQGELYGIIEVARDVTDRLRIEKELRESQSHLYRLAHHDTLTGLPNRLLFRDRLTQAINKAERNRTGVAVLFLDLDRFKQINDTLGHDVGDDLLVEVAARLQRQCRQSDTVARLGGDEFVFVLEAITNRKDAVGVGEKIMTALAAPIRVKGHDLAITTSIGVALFPEDATDLEGVLKCADIALYAAKEIGRSTVQVYRPDMAPDGRRPQLGADQFRAAMQQGGFGLEYLPQTTLTDGQVVGLKAQLYWDHPEMGRLLPRAFLAAADECGLLVEVSRWELERVCRDLHAWRARGAVCVPVTVKLSSRQLAHPEWLPLLEDLVGRHGVGPEMLLLEIRERVLAQAGASTLATLARIGQLGLNLSVADFGGEECPPGRLQHAPVCRLAIGSDLLAEVPRNRRTAFLTAAIIALGHALSLTLLADGIERDDQKTFLRDHACDLIQGPACGPPLTSAKVAEQLHARTQGC